MDPTSASAVGASGRGAADARLASHITSATRIGEALRCPTTVKANNTAAVSGPEGVAEVIRSRSRITQAAGDWIS